MAKLPYNLTPHGVRNSKKNIAQGMNPRLDTQKAQQAYNDFSKKVDSRINKNLSDRVNSSIKKVATAQKVGNVAGNVSRIPGVASRVADVAGNNKKYSESMTTQRHESRGTLIPQKRSNISSVASKVGRVAGRNDSRVAQYERAFREHATESNSMQNVKRGISQSKKLQRGKIENAVKRR